MIFSPSASDEGYGEQRRLLEGSGAGFEDRDLILATIFENEAGKLANGPVSTEEASGLREALGVPKGCFAVVLVGKDGGEKYRSYTPVFKQDIFGRIDAMPMRRRETRNRTPVTKGEDGS